MLEKTLETKCKKFLRYTGKEYDYVKMNLRGRRGWPDRMIIGPRGFVMFIEFKRPKGGRDEPLQKRIQSNLRSRGHYIALVKSELGFARAFQRAVRDHERRLK